MITWSEIIHISRRIYGSEKVYSILRESTSNSELCLKAIHNSAIQQFTITFINKILTIETNIPFKNTNPRLF